MNEISFDVNSSIRKWLSDEATKAGMSVPAFVRKIIKEKRQEDLSKNVRK
ncbi:hypothetical protein [Vibrio parahaemolyticus]|nr:hypothetical protein [Vibrio parahaemolyticus]EIA1494019.1 hypothetical protein [Vibrio parahaemolyticus]ELA7319236.1 hypothetical protein [Vibrio parahaemolyticus]HCG8562164.1 hypothetical protein [Vibrio parahaemolyticus]HCG9580514.1 hypothetical protein [Vibrio parahaemolyticus]HCH6201294.1 hypothetical protein [Vibrio parahaemolyticus]